MEDYNINVYMYLLWLSKKYIAESIKKYQNKSSKATNHNKLYYTIDYHMFTFTQLFYTIHERLKKQYPKDHQKIKDFFNSRGGAVNRLANNLKHGDTMLNSLEIFKVNFDKRRKVTSTKHQTDRTINDPQNEKLKNKHLSRIFEQADIELVKFCKENNYKF